MQTPEGTRGGSTLTVTAIVPARNEEAVIDTCVRSLAAQREITQIIVVNDQSMDRTGEIVARLAAEISSVEVVSTTQMGAGWTGKNHAAWQGAQRATGEWLLFTDADAELLPNAAARALELARETGAALVSFSPEQVTETWYEKALIPFIYCRLARHFRYEEVNSEDPRKAAANGQFLMIRASAYRAIGGHESVSSEVLEDVALAKRAKLEGYRLWFGPGKGIVRVRMYRSFSEMWEGWRKNLYLLVGGTPGAVYLELLKVVPWIWIVFPLVGTTLFPPVLPVVVALVLLAHMSYGQALTRNQFRGIYILYYVPAVILYSDVLWASYRAHRKGYVEWKGRTIQIPQRQTREWF